MDTNQNAQTIDQIISIEGVRGLKRDDALAFLEQKRTYIEGRGIPAEYISLAFEYDQIGEKAIAEELRQKAEALRNEQKDEKGIAEAFDEWVATLPQAEQEIVRLHVYNVHAAFKPYRLSFGEQSAKLLVAAVYMKVSEMEFRYAHS